MCALANPQPSTALSPALSPARRLSLGLWRACECGILTTVPNQYSGRDSSFSPVDPPPPPPPAPPAVTTVHRAGHLDVVKLLLEHGAEVEVKGYRAKSPITGELVQQAARGGDAKGGPPVVVYVLLGLRLILLTGRVRSAMPTDHCKHQPAVAEQWGLPSRPRVLVPASCIGRHQVYHAHQCVLRRAARGCPVPARPRRRPKPDHVLVRRVHQQRQPYRVAPTMGSVPARRGNRGRASAAGSERWR